MSRSTPPAQHSPSLPLPPLRRLHNDDSGMSTVEYAIGTVAAAAFAAVLYAVVSGDSVVTALTDLVQRALSVTF
jgi:Flp pilus assembly pilin Flp